MGYRPNPAFERQLARETGMRRFLGDVADDAAKEIEPRIPYPRMLGGIRVSSSTAMTPEGWEGRVNVSGSWWLWEFGTINHGSRPAVRPGAQAALSRRGGRLGR